MLATVVKTELGVDDEVVTTLWDVGDVGDVDDVAGGVVVVMSLWVLLDQGQASGLVVGKKRMAHQHPPPADAKRMLA